MAQQNGEPLMAGTPPQPGDHLMPTYRAPEALPERLSSKIRVAANGCWEWTAAASRAGYGLVRWDGRMVYAHRLVRHLLVGDVEPQTTDFKTDQIDHLCRNEGCVNPAHLEPVTARENGLRSNNVGTVNARKTHCPKGHPYDETNTYLASSHRRHCRACGAERDRDRGKHTESEVTHP